MFYKITWSFVEETSHALIALAPFAIPYLKISFHVLTSLSFESVDSIYLIDPIMFSKL